METPGVVLFGDRRRRRFAGKRHIDRRQQPVGLTVPAPVFHEARAGAAFIGRFGTLRPGALHGFQQFIDRAFAPAFLAGIVGQCRHIALFLQQVGMVAHQIQMAGVASQHDGQTAGQRLHRIRGDAAHATAGKNRQVAFAQDARHAVAASLPEVDDRFRRNAVAAEPGRQLQDAIHYLWQTLDVRRGGQIALAIRSRAGPGANQQGFRVTLPESAKRRDHDVLTLSVFQPAAGKHRETAGKQAGARRGVKQGAIDARRAADDVAQALVTQHPRIP